MVIQKDGLSVASTQRLKKLEIQKEYCFIPIDDFSVINKGVVRDSLSLLYLFLFVQSVMLFGQSVVTVLDLTSYHNH